MPENINKDDLDFFLKNHLKSVPELELSDNDEKQMISNIMLQTAQKMKSKQNVFLMTWLQTKELSKNVYDNFKIGNIRVLSPQFGIPLLLVIAVSAFLIIKYSSSNEKKEVIITDKKEEIKQDKENFDKKEYKQEDLAKLESENHIQSTILESIPLVYSDRGASPDNSSIEKKRRAAFSVITGVLEEYALNITKQINDSLIVTEWVINSANNNDTTNKQRLVFNYNSKTTNIDAKIQSQAKDNIKLQKKNLNKLYKEIDLEIFQLMKLSK